VKGGIMNTIATYSLNNWGGIEIIAIEYGIDDYVKWHYSHETKIHTSKLFYLNEGVTFKADNMIIPLNECLKTNIK
jgi:hypothetical protein